MDVLLTPRQMGKKVKSTRHGMMLRTRRVVDVIEGWGPLQFDFVFFIRGSLVKFQSGFWKVLKFCLPKIQ